jgi:hypothetical protein
MGLFIVMGLTDDGSVESEMLRVVIGFIASVEVHLYRYLGDVVNSNRRAFLA